MRQVITQNNKGQDEHMRNAVNTTGQPATELGMLAIRETIPKAFVLSPTPSMGAKRKTPETEIKTKTSNIPAAKTVLKPGKRLPPT